MYLISSLSIFLFLIIKRGIVFCPPKYPNFIYCFYIRYLYFILLKVKYAIDRLNAIAKSSIKLPFIVPNMKASLRNTKTSNI